MWMSKRKLNSWSSGPGQNQMKWINFSVGHETFDPVRYVHKYYRHGIKIEVLFLAFWNTLPHHHCKLCCDWLWPCWFHGDTWLPWGCWSRRLILFWGQRWRTPRTARHTVMWNSYTRIFFTLKVCVGGGFKILHIIKIIK